MTQTTPTAGPATPGPANQNTQSLNQLGEDYTRFLTLLTAQISNQDPLSPMDSTQFVSQLAQMSQVEQSVQTNVQLEALRTDVGTLTLATGTQMVGQSVTVASQSAILENGGTETFYRLGAEAASVSAQIIDPLGRVVRTLEDMPVQADTDNALGWDGLDDEGNPVLDGQYDVTLTALDEAGNSMQHLMFRNATVQEVLVHQGQMFVDIGHDEIVGTDALLTITQPS